MKLKKLAAALCAAALSLTAVSFSVFAADTGVAINEKNFPDDNFRKYVSEKCDTDKNGRLSDYEIRLTTGISCDNSKMFSDISYGEMSSLKGIEYFTSLEELYCANNAITELDLSNNTKLTTLFCTNNELVELNVSNCTALESLDCSSYEPSEYNKDSKNRLTTLDVSDCTALESLSCQGNKLTELDVSNNTELELLNCCKNSIGVLDISNNPIIINAYEIGEDDKEAYSGTFLKTISTGTYDEYGLEILYCISADNETKIITETAEEDESPAKGVTIASVAVAGVALVIAGIALVTSRKRK